MYCRICGRDNSGMKLLGEDLCKKCMTEITNISVNDERYDSYKNYIRILLSLYISERHQLNPVN